MRWAIPILVVIASQASGNTIKITVPGDRIEALFPGKSAKVVGGEITLNCMDRRWTVTDRSEYAINCASDEQMALFSRTTRIREFVRYVLVETESGTVVRAATHSVTSNAFGQTSEGRGSLDFEALELLDEIGGKFPEGTQISGNDLGVYGKPPSYVFVIRSVRKGSAAESAGLLPGDEIWKVGKKSIRDRFGLARYFGEVPPGQSVNLEVRRGKETLVIAATATPR